MCYVTLCIIFLWEVTGFTDYKCNSHDCAIGSCTPFPDANNLSRDLPTTIMAYGYAINVECVEGNTLKFTQVATQKTLFYTNGQCHGGSKVEWKSGCGAKSDSFKSKNYLFF